MRPLPHMIGAMLTAVTAGLAITAAAALVAMSQGRACTTSWPTVSSTVDARIAAAGPTRQGPGAPDCLDPAIARVDL